MIGSISLFVYVGQMFISMSQHKQLVLFFALSLLSIVGFIVTSGTLLVQVWALSTAIMAPVGALVILMEEWRRSDGTRPVGAWKSTLLALLYLVIATLFAAIGGMYIAALLGNTKFFMEFEIFRGVKLTFVLPIILVVIAYLHASIMERSHD